MRDETLARYTGAFAAVGGGTWAVAGSFWSALDECREPMCPSRFFYTPTTVSLAELLQVLSMMMLATAGVGVIFVVGRQGSLGLAGAVPGAIGAVTCAVGLASMVLAVGLSDSPGDAYLERSGPGVLAVLAGITLNGVVLLGVPGLARAVGALFVVGALSLAAATNDSMPQAVLVAASGMCWCGAGALLLLGTRDVRAPGRARRSIAAD